MASSNPRKVLVTGGSGFIGSHLTEALLARGDAVQIIDDLSTGRAENLAAVAKHPRLTISRGTVADGALLRAAVADADEVYHLAAAVGVALIAKAPRRTIETNNGPTQLLLDELSLRWRTTGRTARCFIASSSEVYGKNPKPRWNEEDDLVLGPTSRPRWSYGASKAIDEFLALAFWREEQLPVVVGRFFNVVGPRQSGAYGMVLPRFVAAAKCGAPLIVHDDGQQTRCFAHVSDIVSAVTTLIGCDAALGRVFNIGGDQPISILELAKRVVAIVGSSSPIEFQSYSAAYDVDFEDVRVRVPDLTRLRSTIDFQPRFTLDDAIRELAEKGE